MEKNKNTRGAERPAEPTAPLHGLYLRAGVLGRGRLLRTVHRPQEAGDQDGRVVPLELRLCVLLQRQVQGRQSLPHGASDLQHSSQGQQK